MYNFLKLEKKEKHLNYLEKFINTALFSFDSLKPDQENKRQRYKSIFNENEREFYVVLDEEKFASGLILYDYNMRLRDSVVKMNGIGTVCSKIEYRGKGTVSFLLKETLKKLYDEEYVFSTLFPFNTEFYRKYGYELFVQAKSYSINPGMISLKEVNENIVCEEIDFPDEETIEYYKNYASKNYNYVVREKREWKEYLTTSNPNNIKESVVKFKKDGKVSGVVVYNYLKTEKNYTMFVHGMMFNDEETKIAMLNFFKRTEFQIKEIIFNLPEDILLWPYIKGTIGNIKRDYDILGRIVNLDKLNGLKIDNQNIKLKIRIEDDILTQNTGNYILEIKNKELTLIKTNETPDLKTNINIFSAIICGYTNFKEMIISKKVEIVGEYNNHDIEKSVTHMVDFF
jgi:predicted acetyltransferase